MMQIQLTPTWSRRAREVAFTAIALAIFACRGVTQADDTMALLSQFCVDCHGSFEDFPEGGVSLAAEFESMSLRETGATLHAALNAIEGYEMPPADSEQPNVEQRSRLAEGIRRWLSRPSLLGSVDVARADRSTVETDGKTSWPSPLHDPGRPVLRRLTRLEYNNTVRDLLGLETDVFMFSERLPFERSHYQPQSKSMASRLSMAAREYGAKYPVLLPDASMPGDSRAQYGYSNRGDAQNLSAVRLHQYVRMAGEIAFHPDLLSRAERMEELLPNARFRQRVAGAAAKSKPLASSKTQLATNDNVRRSADGSPFNLEEFRGRVDSAFSEDRGGVLSGEELRNTKIAGKGGLVSVAYGKNAIRTFAINPNEDWWFAPFATAMESSGDTLLANYQKGQRRYELTFQSNGGGAFAGIGEIGVVVLSRRGEQGIVRLKVTFDDDSTQELGVALKSGAGVDNTFVSFAAPRDRHIRRLAIDGSEFTGDYVLLDDLAFITRDEPNLQPLVQAEEPIVIEVPKEQAPRARVNRSLAKQSVETRLAHLLRRAFRREVKEVEVAAYVNLYRAAIGSGSGDEAAMRHAIQAILSSPSFLYVTCNGQHPSGQGGAPKNESSSTGDSVTRPNQVVPLTGYELASRLSYFLWSSMPDDELLALAADGRLQDDAALEAQVRRMLGDRRSIELSETFFVEWTKLRELWTAQPDQRQFREFYSGPLGKRTLARDMFGEVLLQFQTILVEDRAVTELIDSEYTFVNGKLMQYYRRDSKGRERDYESLPHKGRDQDSQAASSDEKGLTTSSADDPESSLFARFPDGESLFADDEKNDRIWNRVTRFDQHRGGLFTSPAVLTLTSFPHRTSSIRRGVWILDTVFNRHPPAPKVAVADIDEQQDAASLTLREKVERHRASAACAVCHDRIDPPGFALENFDAIGRWRDRDGDEVIDPSGELQGVGEFHTPEEFRKLLMSQERRFLQGFAEHLLSYALGRKLEYFDVPVVERLVDRTIEDDFRISRLIVEIALSYPFRYTLVDGAASSPTGSPDLQ